MCADVCFGVCLYTYACAHICIYVYFNLIYHFGSVSEIIFQLPMFDYTPSKLSDFR